MDGRLKKKTLILQVLEELIADETAGDPMTGTKWVRRTLRWLQKELHKRGIKAVLSTIRTYLKRLGYSLKSNVKVLSTQKHPHRQEQFEYLLETKKRFLDAKQPVISVDTKKKELIGPFKNAGQTWQRQAIPTLDHDYPSLSEAKLIPYGIYDERYNTGFMYVGLSAETSTFAVDGIVAWWESQGKYLYPGATSLLILCDGGGANGSRRRLWKWALQNQLADRLRLIVTVCHFPPGTSKWNPIEHRLFSFISLNWAGQPLTSVDLALNYMRSTRTDTGLRVFAVLTKKVYPKGIKVTNDQMKSIRLDKHEILSQWNYTIHPHPS